MKIKKIIDLSQPVYHNCPGWPDNKMTEVQYEAIYPVDGYTAEIIKMNVHTGTHLDAPFHFLPNGKTIEDFGVESFQGEAVPINLFGLAPNTPISSNHLEPHKHNIREGDIVLLCTGYGLKRGFSNEYYKEWPYLTEEGATWLLEKKIKGVGIDTLSIGGPEQSTGMAPHLVLLSKNIWALEDLLITEELLEHERWYLFAFPLKLKGFSGSPARAVVMLLE